MSAGFWAAQAGHPALTCGVDPLELRRLSSGQVYLATPYSRLAAPDGVYLPQAARAASEAAVRDLIALAEMGVSAVSPIVLAQAMVDRRLCGVSAPGAQARIHGWALDAGFWTRWCAPILEASACVYVPALPGWRESVGVMHEVAEFLGRPRPVYLEGVI